MTKKLKMLKRSDMRFDGPHENDFVYEREAEVELGNSPIQER